MGEADLLQGDQTSVLVRPTLGSNLRLLFDLFKLRIGLVIGFTAIAGLAVTPGRSLPAWQKDLILPRRCAPPRIM